MFFANVVNYGHFFILEGRYKDAFFNHINSIDENIKFTAETTKADGVMPFLDILVTPKSDGNLSTTVYRRPTHTNQYLQQDSHHAISNKYSVISSLLHRAKDICSNQDQLEEEQTYRRFYQLASILHGPSTG